MTNCWKASSTSTGQYVVPFTRKVSSHSKVGALPNSSLSVEQKTEPVSAGRAPLYGRPTGESYKELDLVTIPEPVPELGIDDGFLGTVDHVYKGGRKVDVAVSRDEDGVIFGYVTVEADPEPHVVAYHVIDDD